MAAVTRTLGGSRQHQGSSRRPRHRGTAERRSSRALRQDISAAAGRHAKTSGGQQSAAQSRHQGGSRAPRQDIRVAAERHAKTSGRQLGNCHTFMQSEFALSSVQRKLKSSAFIRKMISDNLVNRRKAVRG